MSRNLFGARSEPSASGPVKPMLTAGPSRLSDLAARSDPTGSGPAERTLTAGPIASMPAPAQTLSERIPFLDFLRQELAPYPGRGVATLRIVIGCAVVLVLCMTLRVPEAHLAVWAVVRMAMEESSETLLAGAVMLLALTIGLALPLALLPVAFDQPALRFCLIAAMAALGLFLRRT